MCVIFARFWILDAGYWMLGGALTGAQGQEIETYLDFETRFDFLAFQRRDALLEELAIKLEADGSDMTALFGAEQIARPADFQVAHRDFEAAAEGRVLLDGAEPLANV